MDEEDEDDEEDAEVDVEVAVVKVESFDATGIGAETCCDGDGTGDKAAWVTTGAGETGAESAAGLLIAEGISCWMISAGTAWVIAAAASATVFIVSVCTPLTAAAAAAATAAAAAAAAASSCC